jgi:hypothetical protein
MFLFGYPGPAFSFIKDLCQCRQLHFAPLVELEAAIQIDVLPGDRRYPFENLHRLVVTDSLLLFQHAGRDRRIVIDHRIGDEPRALVSDLLLGFGADVQLSGIDVSDGTAESMIRFTAVECFLHALTQCDVVDEVQDV